MNNTEDKTDGLNPSEALYGFCVWLTTRKEKIVMSASDDAAPIVQLIELFCRTNKLPKVRDKWTDNFTYPQETYDG